VRQEAPNPSGIPGPHAILEHPGEAFAPRSPGGGAGHESPGDVDRLGQARAAWHAFPSVLRLPATREGQESHCERRPEHSREQVVCRVLHGENLMSLDEGTQ